MGKWEDWAALEEQRQHPENSELRPGEAESAVRVPSIPLRAGMWIKKGLELWGFRRRLPPSTFSLHLPWSFVSSSPSIFPSSCMDG